MNLFPLPDPLPQPAPHGIVWSLLQITFLLHVVAMNLVLGGSLLALHWRFSRRPDDALQRAALLRFFERARPVVIAAAVTLGIAPLLFLQVLYGRVFFTSSILMGWFWLGLVLLVILGYGGAYRLAFPGGVGRRRAARLPPIVAALFAGVAFLQVTNATRALRPETFREVYRSDARGLTLNLGDPSFWPRYLHVVLGALAVAALAVALLGAWRRTQDPTFARWAMRHGAGLFALASAANVFAGLVFLLTVPRVALLSLVGGSAHATGLLLAGVLLGTTVTGAAILALGARRPHAAVWTVAVLLAPTLAVMLLLREELRRLTLGTAGFERAAWVAPQWGPFWVFLVCLAGAAVAIAWMLAAFARAGRATLKPMRRILPLLLLACGAGASCTRPAASADQRYPIEGTVVAVDAPNRAVTIAHKDIPGFMPAMTMPFQVLEKDAVLLKRTRPGDAVTATLVARDSRYWLEGLVVVRAGKAAAGTGAGTAPREARPGDVLPEVTLVDQAGRRFRLAELRGKAVALTFVYTRCPLPDYCPLMMRHFARAEEVLVADPGLRERTRLLTVSFDTKHDTPEVLRAFGKPFQKTTPPFSHWILASGEDPAIRSLGEALELDYLEETQSFTHNLRTAVLSPAGTLVRLFRGNDWTPEDLVAELRSAAS